MAGATSGKGLVEIKRAELAPAFQFISCRADLGDNWKFLYAGLL